MSDFLGLIREAVSPIPEHIWVRPRFLLSDTVHHEDDFKHKEDCPGCLWHDRNREVWAELRRLAEEQI